MVDDEYYSRMALVEMLQKDFPDARIDQYDDGIPAWDTIKYDPGVDLVITDIRLIAMDGINLAERIHGRYPDIQILFQTGDSVEKLQQMGLQPERCLMKPVIRKELKEKIDHLSDLPEFEIKVTEKEVKIPQAVVKKHAGFLKRMFH